MLVRLPAILAINASRVANPIRQLAERVVEAEGELPTFTRGRLRGHLFRPLDKSGEVLIVRGPAHVPDGYQRVVQAEVAITEGLVDISDGRWLKHPLTKGELDIPGYEREIQRALESWLGAFAYVLEDPARSVVGLRRAQIGAVHAAHAHWASSEATATIVMPTGTGKTEAMLSILVSVGCPRLLVVVPTDALRAQLAEKFLTLGILKSEGSSILNQGARFPLVCTLRHIPRTVREVDDIFARALVIVTTSSIAGQADITVQEQMAHHCPYLFIDEAHHVEAPTWTAFKDRFHDRRILQFTATPFREDGKALDGTIIFKYSLRRAQEDGYFKPIRFAPVVEFNQKRADEAIAARAVEQLRADEGKGHILMARVDSVARAGKVFELYARYPEFRPVELHTGVKSARQREMIRNQIIDGESRIVVCVDMLGEGFDLPELKIAAFHDIRKTLAVTLQLAGRFTRVRPDLGDATFIANTAEVHVQEELRKLYTRDPDWNVLLPELSDRMIGEQLSLQEFLRGFSAFAQEIPLKTVKPATSAVAYRTSCETWAPQEFRAGIPGIRSCEQVYETINHAEHTLVIVTARKVSLEWTDVESLYNWDWELYVVVWSPDQGLLFINSSTNAGEYRALAVAIAGESARLINGQEVFRAFAGVNRLRLQNVGLTEQLGRNVRFTGRMGADIEPALPGVQRHRARKSVLAGTGYEDGLKTTIGASRKGRIWSHRRGHVDELAAWCKGIGTKLLDDTIDPDEVLKGTLEAKTVVERPKRMPIAIDWPEEMYRDPEAMWVVVVGSAEYSLSDLSLELISPSESGRLRFAIAADDDRVEVELELLDEEDNPTYRYIVHDKRSVHMRRGGHSERQSVADFFFYEPPVIWFADGSALEGNQYVELKNVPLPYDASKIEAWTWAGVDIRKESQGQEKEADSIQASLIRELHKRDYKVIIDDDSKGEAADVVAIRLVGDVDAPVQIDVEFYHCKYSQGATPGQRIKDLYEVCGQAQKSILWLSAPEKLTDLFTHLLRRAASRQEAGGASRYELGDAEVLHTLREMSRLCRVTLKIYIVQPGLSKHGATREQRALLSVTEHYLMETYQVSFGVIASA